MPEPVFSDTEALAALCRRHAIIRASLFGSVLKGTAGPASDVDLLLVEFMPGRAPGLLALAASKPNSPPCWMAAASIYAQQPTSAAISATT